jgi:SAM-dependent methyltransferase
MATEAFVDVEGIDPEKCFEQLIEALSKSLERSGLHLEGGIDGRVSEGGEPIGRVLSWQPGKKVELEWHHADLTSKIEFNFDARLEGTRVTLSWDRPMDGDTALGWFAEQVAAPLLKASSSANFGDWFTDRRARKPSGPAAKNTYGDPIYHKPNFLAILKELALTKEDYMLEVGCGGGVLLNWALKSGCRAAAIDHSSDMVALAKETNADAIREKRLEIFESNAYPLPFPDSIFTCAVSTGVFGFISDPLAAMGEIRRTMKNGGRFVMFTGTKELKGTPAAPEPMASRLHFYEDAELVELARRAGFEKARVDHPDMSGYARQVGLPEEVVTTLFSGDSKSGQLLVAIK